MKVMVRGCATAAVLVCLGALAPGVGLAHSKPAALKTHQFNLSGAIETLSTTGAIATPGVKDTDAGILDGTISKSPHFSGALRQVVTWGNALAITAKGTVFGPSGSLRFKLTGKFAPTPGVGLALSAKVTVTGGTGVYSGARGSLKASGVASVSGGSTKSSLKLTGKVRYRG
jgi:hypothetical protein